MIGYIPIVGKFGDHASETVYGRGDQWDRRYPSVRCQVLSGTDVADLAPLGLTGSKVRVIKGVTRMAGDAIALVVPCCQIREFVGV